MTIDVHGLVPGADQASFDEASREAERTAWVSRALQDNVESQVHAMLDERLTFSVAQSASATMPWRRRTGIEPACELSPAHRF